MARDTDHLADNFETENAGGLLSGFLAEEDLFDRRTLWRLGSWGVASVGAVIVALLANQFAIGMKRDQVATADLARQSQQIQSVAKESQDEARRLASAIDTLNGDRDRLYSRITVLEQGLDTVTGTVARQNLAVPSPQAAAPATTTTEPQVASQSPPPAPAVSPVTTTVAKTSEKPKLDANVAAEKPKTDAVAAAERPKTNVVAAAEKPKTDAAAAAEKPKTEAPVAAEKPKTDTTVAAQGPATVPPTGEGAPNSQGAMQASALMASKSMMAPPDAAAGKLMELDKPLNSAPPVPLPALETVAVVSLTERDSSDAAGPKVAVQRTEFAVDVGGANSIGGLRALWRGLLKSNAALSELRPIIVVKEGRTGLGMQLRLAAGPLSDAAAAAKICADLIENQRTCEMTIFDGQRLAVKTDEPAATKPPGAKSFSHRRGVSKRLTSENTPAVETSTLASFFSYRPSP
jgi:hypothetical protein